MSDKVLLRQFEVEVAALAGSDLMVQVNMSALDAWVLMGQLQLAALVPDNAERMSLEIALQVAKTLEAAIPMGPAMEIMLARGWDQVETWKEMSSDEAGD